MNRCKVCNETDQSKLDYCAYEMGGIGPRCDWEKISPEAGPVGFQHIESAPKDGRYVRLRFRPALWMPAEHEVLARWEPHEEMKAGGWWFTEDGGYVSPGPLFWSLPAGERE